MLRIGRLKPAAREFFNAESTSEEAAPIADRFELNEPSITQRCWVKLHGPTSAPSWVRDADELFDTLDCRPQP